MAIFHHRTSLTLHGLTTHVLPRHFGDCGLQSQAITWNTNHNWRNSPVFFKRRYSHPLYKLLDDDPTLCKLNRKATTRFDAVYIVAPFYTDLSLSSNDFTPVDIHMHNTGLSIVGVFLGINDTDSPPIGTPTLQAANLAIDLSLHQICGDINFPPDNGTTIIHHIERNANEIFASSDASLKNN
jgi:hypothetical protein